MAETALRRSSKSRLYDDPSQRAQKERGIYGEHRTMLIGLALLAVLSCILFMTVGARGSWSFVLPFRGQKLGAMILVGHATAMSTVLFQTISANRILTPSIMGFDALYALIQTVLVFATGAAFTVALDPLILFSLETTALVAFATLLYGTLLGTGAKDIHRLLLIGVILGVLFRSLAGLMQRLIDPAEFVIIQDRLYASFNTIDGNLLAISSVLIGFVTLAVVRMLPIFDALALGRDLAISIGIDHQRKVLLTLGIIAILVAISTALVGPVAFFGLLVASLARSLVGSRAHGPTLLAASLVSVVALVAGQTILERVLAFDSAIGIVVEFLGGIVFLALLLKRGTA